MSGLPPRVATGRLISSPRPWFKVHRVRALWGPSTEQSRHPIDIVARETGFGELDQRALPGSGSRSWSCGETPATTLLRMRPSISSLKPER